VSAIRQTHNFVVASESKQGCKTFALEELRLGFHLVDLPALRRRALEPKVRLKLEREVHEPDGSPD